MADDSPLQKASSSRNDPVTISSRDLVAAEKPISEEAKKLEFSEDEETLIIRMYNLVGDRWSLIAGRIPGRSPEEIEEFWKKSRHSTHPNK